ncbi:hypothetical protein Q1695_003854 [Nippostrongylus brasiliensis]|nr:hypothetical protein Q1695_003854 [Nippostrongylus brasiliensis]
MDGSGTCYVGGNHSSLRRTGERAVMATQAAPKTRGGNNSTPGGTMTWASSRRLVITNDVPQIVVGGGSSSRGQERSAAAFPVPPAYSLRGATGQVSIRGGFQTTRGVSNATYAPRCPTTAQRGDESRNPEDSEDENEDGRTSPDVLSTSIRSNEDTWDFWDRVYSDPELRQSMQERQRDSPMAELLHSDKLCKAQVVFLNVPRLAYGQQHVVRSLIHREISSNLPILDIHITYRKWTVRFYRSEDAVQVLRHFNGFSFRNHKLLVRACQSNAAFGDATALEEAAQVENEERRATPGALPPDGAQRVDLDSLWTATEWKDIMDFKKDLITILEGKQTGMVLSEALAETGVSQRRGIVAAAAELWPTGLIRILLPEVKAIGRCVCLAGHEDMAALVRRAAQEGTPRLMTDSWEPIPPCEIRTEQHLLSYLAAFLSHFGPQHTIIDIPLRLLIKSLSGNWPATGPALAEWATKRSYQFIVMFEVLYLATSIRHRRILVEAVQPLSTLKFKFLNAANRC